MASRTKATTTRNGNGNTPVTDRVSYIRAFRVRNWVRIAGELRPQTAYPAISVSRQRGQRPL